MHSIPSSAEAAARGAAAAMSERKRPSLPLRGGCACGAIRYQVRAMPLFLYACHCTDCQRHSGSAFSMGLPVAAATFQIERGQAKAWQFVGAAGIPTRFWFCATCGGRIYGERDGSERVNLRAGTLDDTSWLVPLAHYFMRSAQAWERLAGDVACFATLPSETEVLPLVKEWRELWQSD
jgi:hypothetical protein